MNLPHFATYTWLLLSFVATFGHSCHDHMENLAQNLSLNYTWKSANISHIHDHFQN